MPPVHKNKSRSPDQARLQARLKNINGGRRWASVVEAASYLGVTTRTIRQMTADGRITAYRAGSRLVRIDLNEIDAALEPYGGAV